MFLVKLPYLRNISYNSFEGKSIDTGKFESTAHTEHQKENVRAHYWCCDLVLFMHPRPLIQLPLHFYMLVVPVLHISQYKCVIQLPISGLSLQKILGQVTNMTYISAKELAHKSLSTWNSLWSQTLGLNEVWVWPLDNQR